MMKKILFLSLCTALFATACSNDDNEGGKNPSNNGTFIGTLDVTPVGNSPFNAFSEDDITFRIEKQSNGTYTLHMPKIKFVEQMPFITCEVRALTPKFDEVGYAFSVAETVPYRNGEPYDPKGDGKYTIRDMKGENSAGAILQVAFDCYGMHVEYLGTIKK